MLRNVIISLTVIVTMAAREWNTLHVHMALIAPTAAPGLDLSTALTLRNRGPVYAPPVHCRAINLEPQCVSLLTGVRRHSGAGAQRAIQLATLWNVISMGETAHSMR